MILNPLRNRVPNSRLFFLRIPHGTGATTFLLKKGFLSPISCGQRSPVVHNMCVGNTGKTLGTVKGGPQGRPPLRSIRSHKVNRRVCPAARRRPGHMRLRVRPWLRAVSKQNCRFFRAPSGAGWCKGVFCSVLADRKPSPDGRACRNEPLILPSTTSICDIFHLLYD